MMMIDSELAFVILAVFCVLLLSAVGFQYCYIKKKGKVFKAETERARERVLAHNIQQSMMPGNDSPVFSGRDDFEVYGRMKPIDSIGGDFYDCFLMDDFHLVFVVADISSTGMPAAIEMSTIRACIRNYSTGRKPLVSCSGNGFPALRKRAEEMLFHTNNVVSDEMPEGVTVSLWLGILDTSCGVMSCIEAGHVSPYIRHESGEFNQMYIHKNPRLGISHGIVFKATEVRLVPGDRLFLCSKAIAEQCNVKGDAYGISRMESILYKARNNDIRKLVDGLMSDVLSFTGRAKRSDDLTMLCIDFKRYHDLSLKVSVSGRDSIDKFGGVKVDLGADKLLALGIGYGDLVTLTWPGHTEILPVVPNFRYVGQGISCILVWPNPELKSIVLDFGGDFARDRGFKDESCTYPVEMELRLFLKGGYMDEYKRRDLNRSNTRSDYPKLSDEQYANFRQVTSGGIAPGKLFRGSSPISPVLGRNSFADEALRRHAVKSVFNLDDSSDKPVTYPGFSETYYSTLKLFCYRLGSNFSSESERIRLYRIFKDMSVSDTPFYVHCIEGQDRTGFVIAVLECLMGADYKEIIEDYMMTYSNYYGVERDTLDYNVIMQNIVCELEDELGLARLSKADLSIAAEAYISGLGLTADETASLKARLS